MVFDADYRGRGGRSLLWRANFTWRLAATSPSFVLFSPGGAAPASPATLVLLVLSSSGECRRKPKRWLLNRSFRFYIKLPRKEAEQR